MIALVVIGVFLIGIGVWLFRQTRVDPELLAPLERMADRLVNGQPEMARVEYEIVLAGLD